ncbi:MAG: hypothetical protein ACRC92_11290 [Peptostreptococcaceae bacterium]
MFNRELFLTKAKNTLSLENFKNRKEILDSEIKRLSQVSPVQPRVLMVMTKDDPASKMFVGKKEHDFKEYGIEPIVATVTKPNELYNRLIKHSVMNTSHLPCWVLPENKCTSAIIQIPLGEGFPEHYREYIDMISPKCDIDRLGSKYYSYNIKYENLPVTTSVLVDLLIGLYQDYISSTDDDSRQPRLLLIGNGITTNHMLFRYEFDKRRFDVRIVNTKTSNEEFNNCVDWADIIISSTGVKGILKCENKVVISPTIIRTESGDSVVWDNDLDRDFRDKNATHRVTGTVGKLTVAKIALRAYTDAINQIKRK